MRKTSLSLLLGSCLLGACQPASPGDPIRVSSECDPGPRGWCTPAWESSTTDVPEARLTFVRLAHAYADIHPGDPCGEVVVTLATWDGPPYDVQLEGDCQDGSRLMLEVGPAAAVASSPKVWDAR